MYATALLVAVLTLAAGLAVGVLLGRRHTDDAARAAVARAEADGRDAVAAAEAAGRAAAAGVQDRLHVAQEEVVRLSVKLESERDAAVAAAHERRESQAQVEARLREAFGSLAGEALRRNNEAFAELADARLAAARASAEGDLGQRQQAIEGMVAPLRDSLQRVQQQLRTIENERTGSYSELLTQIGTMRQTSDQLRSETAQLVNALRAPQVRGRWGEMQLERAVEAAGMTEHIDYVTQETVSGDDGRLRPDLVVRLVGGKSVVVDSKVAFAGYLEAAEAKDDATRAARLKAHARHLRTHIDQLGAKSYFEHFAPTPEFVVCFVPADAFLDAALKEEPGLLERAFEQNVVLATPSTLVALLRTIAYTWRQDALAANAAEVHKLGRDLYQRLSTMGKHVDKLGRSLNTAVGSYNETVASLEGRVLVTARKMADLKVIDPADQLDAPRQINEVTRSAQAPELVEQRLVALPKKGAPAPGQGELPTAAGDGQ